MLGLETRPAGSRPRVLLVNMPFAAISTPSLALGLLKAELARAGVACDVLYLNVLFAQMVGWSSYGVVERSSALLAGEQMFAHDLFGGRIPPDHQYRAEVLSRVEPKIQHELRHLKAHIPSFLANCLERISWDAYDIIGFSSVFEQNVPSLSLARRVKEGFPRSVIVFGGANCEGIMGLALHRCFPFVDYVITGEADIAFPQLVRRLGDGDPVDDLRGVVYRRGGASVDTGPPDKIVDLDGLPFPDFGDYFEILDRTGAPSGGERHVVLETARGCWWGEKAKCTFCGLNGESIAFRAKSPDRAVEEIVHLVRAYRPRYVRTVDNMMAPSYYDAFLPRLAAANLGVDLFYEVRPTLSKVQIDALARARVTSVQAGIESLSTHMLKLMRKGTTSLRNLEFLKQCRQAGIYVDWNLLFGFPGEQVEDYESTLDLASLITHLDAPSSVGEIRLDRFSPNFEHAEEFGFTNTRPWSLFKYVYPFDRETLMDLVYYFDCDRREVFDDHDYLSRLVEHVSGWKRRNDRLLAQRVNGSLVIDDSRPVGLARQTVLTGIRKDIYEYCDTRRTLAQVDAWLAESRGQSVGTKKLRLLLDEFGAKRLMVEEHGWYLSLALLRDDPVPANAQPRVARESGARSRKATARKRTTTKSVPDSP
ncbi:MAG: RiPP maturation radical SAM C-methyltransferase [Acidobacteria bacterium]|nr:RiPP maturation radical SAM C-methyltransferase [Acidobacteriota bacterium]